MQTPKHEISTVDIVALICAIMFIVAGCKEESRTDISGIGWMHLHIDVSENDIAKPIAPFSIEMQSLDGLYHHKWNDVAEFPNFESYHVGPYSIRAVSGNPEAEGYDCQAYCGMSQFNIVEGQTIDVAVQCHLAQALAKYHFDDNSDSYDIQSGFFHSSGYGYIEYPTSESRLALIKPGNTSLLVQVVDKDGQQITLAPALAISTQAGAAYLVEASIDNDNVLTIADKHSTESIALSDELFASQAPNITAQGFTPEHPVTLVEGYPSSQHIAMEVDAPAGISSIVLTTMGIDGLYPDFPNEIDLQKDAAVASKYGLEVASDGANKATIDFTKFVEGLSVTENSQFTFNLVAIDRLRRASAECALSINIQSIDLDEVVATKAIIGIDQTSVTIGLTTSQVEADDFSFYEIDASGNDGQQIHMLQSKIDSQNNTITFDFLIPEGIDPVPVRIYYMDNPKGEVNIERSVPEYSLVIDPFATYALAQINCENKASKEAIAKYANFYIGDKQIAISDRDAEHGIVKMVGLESNSRYAIQAITIKGEYAPSVNIVTESIEQVPEGDFENTVKDFSYDDLRQGGIYSNTVFPIYNMQNYTSLVVAKPEKYWASVNAKTFNTSASNHNSWYMQPSCEIDATQSSNGKRSIKLQSVGWSLDGEEIEPYVQDIDNYLPYNANVPATQHVAAGKLFLGSYTFDAKTMTETYNEGVAFGSRPSSLNGFYKYVPDRNASHDYGLLRIEIVNDDVTPSIVIASAQQEIHSTGDFVSFNLPLEYPVIGIKATKLKIMISSSNQCGDIQHEDIYVPVTADVEMSRYIGSQLWIDNLTFSY